MPDAKDMDTVGTDMTDGFNVTGLSLTFKGGNDKCPGDMNPDKYYQLKLNIECDENVEGIAEFTGHNQDAC